jgi:hypothetical protein
VKNRTTQSALLVAGAAVGVAAAAAWVGKRRHSAEVKPSWEHNWEEEKTGIIPKSQRSQPSLTPRTVPDDFIGLVAEDLVEADGPELPIGRSADPEIDDALRPVRSRHDDTSGSSLFSEPEPDRPLSNDISLDQIWDATPGFAEGEQTEGYDAVTPEDLGSIWLERATQTTHESRPHASDRADVPELEDLAVSEATRGSALALDDEEAGEAEDEEQAARDAEGDEDDDPNAIQEDDLDEDTPVAERDERDKLPRRL